MMNVTQNAVQTAAMITDGNSVNAANAQAGIQQSGFFDSIFSRLFGAGDMREAEVRHEITVGKFEGSPDGKVSPSGNTMASIENDVITENEIGRKSLPYEKPDNSRSVKPEGMGFLVSAAANHAITVQDPNPLRFVIPQNDAAANGKENALHQVATVIQAVVEKINYVMPQKPQIQVSNAETGADLHSAEVMKGFKPSDILPEKASDEIHQSAKISELPFKKHDIPGTAGMAEKVAADSISATAPNEAGGSDDMGPDPVLGVKRHKPETGHAKKKNLPESELSVVKAVEDNNILMANNRMMGMTRADYEAIAPIAHAKSDLSVADRTTGENVSVLPQSAAISGFSKTMPGIPETATRSEKGEGEAVSAPGRNEPGKNREMEPGRAPVDNRNNSGIVPDGRAVSYERAASMRTGAKNSDELKHDQMKELPNDDYQAKEAKVEADDVNTGAGRSPGKTPVEITTTEKFSQLSAKNAIPPENISTDGERGTENAVAAGRDEEIKTKTVNARKPVEHAPHHSAHIDGNASARRDVREERNLPSGKADLPKEGIAFRQSPESEGFSKNNDDISRNPADSFQGNRNSTDVDAVGSNFEITGQTNAQSQKTVSEQAKPSSHEHILAQVREKLAVHQSNGESGRITLKLNPEELGELKVSIKMDGQRLTVDILADSQPVKDALMQNLDSLRETLSRQNIAVDRFNVLTGGGTGYGEANWEWRQHARNTQPDVLMKQFVSAEEPAEDNAGYLDSNDSSLIDLRF